MSKTRNTLSLAAAAVAVSAVPSAQALDLFNVGSVNIVVDSLGIDIGQPFSAVFDGTDAYVGTGFTAGSIFQINDVLTSPTLGATGFSSAVVGNGFTNMDLFNDTLVASSSNGSITDTLQVFDISSGTPVASSFTPLNPDGDLSNSGLGARFDGVAIDPGNVNGVGGGTIGGGAGVVTVGFGSGSRRLIDPVSGNLIDGSVSLFNSSTNSGFRDVDFDGSTGDVYIRTLDGVGVGVRSGDNGFQTLTGSAGTQGIVSNNSGFDVLLHVEHLGDFAGDGGNLVAYNDTQTDGTLVNSVKIVEQDGTSVPLSFLTADGSGAFTQPLQTADALLGRYDFSYDPGSGLLMVADTQNAFLHFFSTTASGGGVTGDFDGDSDVDADDIDLLFAEVPGTVPPSDEQFDLTGDDAINGDDVTELVEVILGTRLGDLNLDGNVDGNDFGIFAGNFGGVGPSGYAEGDLNGDGLVDGNDFGIFAGNFGFSSGALAAVPEPASLAMLSLGGLVALRRRR